MKYLTATRIDGRTFDFNLPETPDEMTYGQAAALADLNPEDPYFGIQAVSILTSIPQSQWENTTDTRAFLLLQAECLNLMVEGQKRIITGDDRPFDRKVTIAGQTIELPDDIGHCTVGQYQDCLAIIKKAYADKDKTEEVEGGKSLSLSGALSVYGDIFRIYAQPIFDGPDYSYTKSMRMEIGECSLNHVLSFASFFLANLGSSKSGIAPAVAKSATNRSKFRQAIKKLLRNLGFSSRSTD